MNTNFIKEEFPNKAKMNTKKKIESNRKNAQKSTGPRSKAGKAIVNQNARTHGLLSSNLIIEGESQKDFLQLMSRLNQEFQPVGVVEHALVERVAISFWRQCRLVTAESAKLSFNRQNIGQTEVNEVVQALNLKYNKYKNLKALENDLEKKDPVTLSNERKLWISLITRKVAYGKDPFSQLPAVVQKELLEIWKIDASEVNSYVKKEYGSWLVMFNFFLDLAESLIEERRILEMSMLILKNQIIPSQTDLLIRYQTALDNDLYKALKVLREAQAWRESKNIITVAPVPQIDYSGGK